MIDDSAIKIYYREYGAMSRWVSEQEQQRKKRIKRMKSVVTLSILGIVIFVGLGLGFGWFGRASDLAQERYCAPNEASSAKE